MAYFCIASAQSIFYMSIAIGEKAPSFTLRDTTTNEVSLSDYHGKNVLVLFFPLAFTGVCTKELCGIRDELNQYQKLNTDIVAISVDSPFTLGKFKEEQSYNFPLLSDFNRDVSRAYGSIYEDFVLGLKGVSKRAAFIIDKEGTVKYSEILDNAGDMPNFESIKQNLAALS